MRNKRYKGRKVDGILLLDKPVGMSSNQALQRIKRIFGARKAGHTGNLDPMASGVLPICFGEATKMSAFLLDADKGYRGVIRLGERTASGDSEADVVERLPVPELEVPEVEAVLHRFTGEIQQVPPMYSALKHRGQPLYRLARQGIEVARAPRTVTIHRLSLLALAKGEMTVDIRCSKGTYIRTLAEDIGRALGTCAHLGSLVRTEAGPFRLQDAVTLAHLEEIAGEGMSALDDHLLPMEKALEEWPAVALSQEAAYYLRKGQPVFVPRLSANGWIRLYDEKAVFLGVGTVLDDGRVAPKRLLNTG